VPPPDAPDANAPDANVVHEYATLAAELVRQRRLRLRVFAFATLVVVGILALTFALNPVAEDTRTARLVLIYLAHVVVLVALLFTHRVTYRMAFTAGYLEAIVEPRVPVPSPRPRRRPFQSLESSRALGACYALLISTIVAAGMANGLYETMWALGLPMLAIIGVLNANLLFMSGVADPRRGPSVRRAAGDG
jgi:hypothetical protein